MTKKAKYAFGIHFIVVMLLSFSGVAKESRTLQIIIEPVFNSQELVLSTKSYVSPSGDTLQIDRFRFYLSAVEVVFSDGTVYTEKDSYHLIDAEVDSTLLLNLSDVPAGEIAAVRFSIGVDSIKSVSGAFGGDLDPVYGMYWAWNSGYIHAKLEGRSKSCATHQNAFEYHVGGFAAPENAIRKVELKTTQNDSGFTGSLITITADAAKWLTNVSLKKTPSVVIPGAKAMAIANDYVNMFMVMLPDENE